MATNRFAVRRATSDDGLTLYWLVDLVKGERILSSVFVDTLDRLADAMNRRHPEAGRRAEAGLW